MSKEAAHSKFGIFFDVDDTLYDHLTPFCQAVDTAARTGADFPYEAAYHRMRYYSDMLSHQMGGAGAMEAGDATERMRRERFRLALAEFGIELSAEQAQAMQAAYIGCQYEIVMFDGARELLERLVRAGHVVGLITNGASAHQRRKIDAMQLDAVIPRTHQFVSGETGWDKPDVRLFAHVNDATGTLPSRSLYIGDSWRNDVVGALEAGWQAIWFNHRGAQAESDHIPHAAASGYAELERAIEARLRAMNASQGLTADV